MAIKYIHYQDTFHATNTQTANNVSVTNSSYHSSALLMPQTVPLFVRKSAPTRSCEASTWRWILWRLTNHGGKLNTDGRLSVNEDNKPDLTNVFRKLCPFNIPLAPCGYESKYIFESHVSTILYISVILAQIPISVGEQNSYDSYLWTNSHV